MTNKELEVLKNQFIEKMFKNEWVRKIENGNFIDDDLLRYCLDKAWPDAIIYVRKKNSQNDETILNSVEDIKNLVFSEIKQNSYQKNYDQWHDDMCKNTTFGMRYGVWQKYINMCFKYIYCINDKLKNPINFDFNNCHMPLDDNSLLWCRNNEITTIEAWNNISRDEYINIRDGIKNYLRGNKNIDNALQIDFIVWRVKKICDVLIKIKNIDDDLEGLDNCKEWFSKCGYDIKDKDKVKSVTKEMEKLINYINK